MKLIVFNKMKKEFKIHVVTISNPTLKNNFKLNINLFSFEIALFMFLASCTVSICKDKNILIL